MGRIVFNGQAYPSVEAMPPDARKAYEQVMGMFADKDQDGVPDILQGGGVTPTVIEQSSFVVNGTPYASLEAMPPEVRRMYDQAMGAMGTMGAGFGDGGITFSASVGSPPPPASAPPVVPTPDARRVRGRSDGPRWGEEAPAGGLPWVLILGVLVVVLAFALAWVLMR